jgi:hypothetical protein
MNNTSSFIQSSIFVTNSTRTIIELWFIPVDILMIICTILTILLTIFLLFVIIIDKTCHTVSMISTANSCLSVFLFGCSMLSLCTFTFINDIKQIQFEDSLCNFRGYFCYVTGGLVHSSFLLQGLYAYLNVVYPNRLVYQSIKFQSLLICLSWIFDFMFPLIFLFNNEIVYNVDNQICQLTLRLSFSIIYMSSCAYTIPILLVIWIYFKLVRYVHEMSHHITPVNTLFRAQRELKMVQRIVILTIFLLVFGVPYMTFIFISFFTTPPTYHFRLAFLFADLSLIFIIIALLQFTDPLKASIMKRIKRRQNMVVGTINT